MDVTQDLSLLGEDQVISVFPAGIGDALRNTVAEAHLKSSLAKSLGVPNTVVLSQGRAPAGAMRRRGILEALEHDPRIDRMIMADRKELADHLGGTPTPTILDLEHRDKADAVAQAPICTVPQGLYAPPNYGDYVQEMRLLVDRAPSLLMCPFGRGDYDVGFLDKAARRLLRLGWALIISGGGEFDRVRQKGHPGAIRIPAEPMVRKLHEDFPGSVSRLRQDAGSIFRVVAAADLCRAGMSTVTWSLTVLTLWDRHFFLVGDLCRAPSGEYTPSNRGISDLIHQDGIASNRVFVRHLPTPCDLVRWCTGVPETDSGRTSLLLGA
jgi:hypothetical protein